MAELEESEEANVGTCQGIVNPPWCGFRRVLDVNICAVVSLHPSPKPL
jgi:hypothetical protein